MKKVQNIPLGTLVLEVWPDSEEKILGMIVEYNNRVDSYTIEWYSKDEIWREDYFPEESVRIWIKTLKDYMVGKEIKTQWSEIP